MHPLIAVLFLFADPIAMPSITKWFPTQRKIQLEFNEKWPLMDVQQAVQTGDNLFLLDVGQELVFRYSTTGKFLGVVGATGEGPGEYYSPGHIADWNGGVAITSYATGRVTTYDSHGRFQTTLKTRTALGVLRHDDSFFVVQPLSTKFPAPLFQIGDAKTTELMPAAFGEVFEPFRSFSWGADVYAVTADGHLWIGSPYLGSVKIFNAKGTQVQEVEVTHPDSLRKEDFEAVTRKTERRESDRLFTRLRCHRVIAAGEFVIVIFQGGGNRVVSLYRSNGALIAPRVDLGDACHLVGGGKPGFLGLSPDDEAANSSLVCLRRK